MKHVISFDQRMADLVARLPKLLHTPFDLLGYLTPPIAWFSLILAYALAFARNDQAQLEGTFVVLVLLPLGSLIKFLFKRRRPPTIYVDKMRIKSYSFPSSHAYSAALGGSYVAGMLFGNGYIVLGILCSALIGIIGVSRVFLGAHYPSDVLAGWMLGLTLSVSVATLL